MEPGSTHFDVTRAADAGPVVVEVPHAGLVIDEASSRFTRVPAVALAAGALAADSDLGADLVWEGSEKRGVTRIVACASRYVIDLNTVPRVATAYEDKMPPALRSVLRHSHCGQKWREAPLPKHEVERRIREVFDPYHEQIAVELERARALFGATLLIASHTFPDAGADAADIVLGTRHGASASEALRDELADVMRLHGFSVAVEVPFPGGFSTVRHARREDGVSVVQVEIARRVLSTDRRNSDTDPAAVARVATMFGDVVIAATASLRSMTSPRG